MMVKEGKVQKVTLEATLGRGLQVQEKVLIVGYIRFLWQELLLVGHVILNIPKET